MRQNFSLWIFLLKCLLTKNLSIKQRRLMYHIFLCRVITYVITHQLQVFRICYFRSVNVRNLLDWLVIKWQKACIKKCVRYFWFPSWGRSNNLKYYFWHSAGWWQNWRQCWVLVLGISAVVTAAHTDELK